VINHHQFQLGLSFFGLTPNNIPEYRLNLFKEIHEIAFHGQGGYNFEIVYNMPIWLRKFTYNSMHEFYSKKSEALNGDQNKNSVIDASGKINKDLYQKISYK
jgi:hypothetical protein